MVRLHGNSNCSPSTRNSSAANLTGWARLDSVPAVFSDWRRNVLMNDEFSKWTILRDPLERFMSAYIDKCESHYVVEGHCEPVEHFTSNSSWRALGRQQVTSALCSMCNRSQVLYVCVCIRWLVCYIYAQLPLVGTLGTSYIGTYLICRHLTYSPLKSQLELAAANCFTAAEIPGICAHRF